MKKISLPFIFVLALTSALWLPNLFTKGMFMDGVYNALFAHNLVHNIGDFWTPQTADYAHSSYWDNPQLSAYFLSLWYKFFGDHYWVEKLYSLFCALVQLALINSLWKIYFSDKEDEKKYSWVPCLLFLIIPLTSWCYSSNMMENTMSIFTTASIIVFLLFQRAKKHIVLYSVIGGSLIFLALLTKGPVALFPLAAPLLFVLAGQNFNWKKSFNYMLLQAFVTIGFFVFVFSMEAPNFFLHHYLEVQLLPVLNHQAKGNTSHFTILLQLLVALLPLFLLSIGSPFFYRKRITDNKSLFQAAIAFFVIGLSASVPIIFSAKQNKHYLLPSLPLFAVGFACLNLPFIKWIEEKVKGQISEKILTVAKTLFVVVIGFCLFLSVRNAGSYSRDEDLLRDIEKIQSFVKTENVIRADWSLYNDWALRANLNRLYDKKICMPDDVAKTNFYLTKSNEPGDQLPSAAEKIYSGKKFDLYQF